MSKNVLVERVLKFLRGFRIEYLADVSGEPESFGKLDAAVLKVAMTVAALDGHVTDDELDAFLALAKKCRGFSADRARSLFLEGLRPAGYVELASRTIGSKELMGLFTREVEEILPESFPVGHAQDVRRAFVMWTAMAMADGDFSPIERRAINALVEMVRSRVTAKEEANKRRSSLSPAFAAAYHEEKGDWNGEILSRDFFRRAEKLISKLIRSEADAAATAELKNLIING